MDDFFQSLANAWEFFFGWLPSPLDVIATILIGLIVVVLLIKIIAAILDAIPFL